ncbi:hypothetical protein DM02DRAFT_731683 [Periconia macrospinosa]|uniref:Mitotic-spindle organizing protein 1 n=1 Tax=Periconia macrospinosa TaxID=97972 RepID=A0A2V1DC92_9PLEO|nr:hypothetical protein DM02DRAFT_731683 [Periconia macrospinosa]
MPAEAVAPTQEVKRKAAREVIDILHDIATLLNTHLDRQQLSYCVSLIENGANPEALALAKLAIKLAYCTAETPREEQYSREIPHEITPTRTVVTHAHTIPRNLN